MMLFRRYPGGSIQKTTVWWSFSHNHQSCRGRLWTKKLYNISHGDDNFEWWSGEKNRKTENRWSSEKKWAWNYIMIFCQVSTNSFGDHFALPMSWCVFIIILVPCQIKFDKSIIRQHLIFCSVLFLMFLFDFSVLFRFRLFDFHVVKYWWSHMIFSLSAKKSGGVFIIKIFLEFLVSIFSILISSYDIQQIFLSLVLQKVWPLKRYLFFCFLN